MSRCALPWCGRVDVHPPRHHPPVRDHPLAQMVSVRRVPGVGELNNGGCARVQRDKTRMVVKMVRENKRWREK
jgi:hypothetical protein